MIAYELTKAGTIGIKLKQTKLDEYIKNELV